MKRGENQSPRKKWLKTMKTATQIIYTGVIVRPFTRVARFPIISIKIFFHPIDSVHARKITRCFFRKRKKKISLLRTPTIFVSSFCLTHAKRRLYFSSIFLFLSLRFAQVVDLIELKLKLKKTGVRSTLPRFTSFFYSTLPILLTSPI